MKTKIKLLNENFLYYSKILQSNLEIMQKIFYPEFTLNQVTENHTLQLNENYRKEKFPTIFK